VAVFHKDVQLFHYGPRNFWTTPSGRFTGGDGLSGSPWYWEMVRRWKTAPCPEISLKNEKLEPLAFNDPRRPCHRSRCGVGGTDGLILQPQGWFILCWTTTARCGPRAVPAGDMVLYRGRTCMEKRRTFSRRNLIGDHARAPPRSRGLYFLSHKIPARRSGF